MSERNAYEENHEGISVTPSDIIEYLYCPRYIYFMYVLAIPQHEELYYKAMKGREIHEKKKRTNTDYLRKRLGVIDKKADVYLTGKHLRGIIDEILFLEDGTAAPLDYKYAVYNERVYKTLQTQAHCYAKLITENFGKKVNTAYLVYIRSKNKLVEIPITEKGLAAVDKYISEIVEIIGENKFPKATTAKTKCMTCTYRNLCVK